MSHTRKSENGSPIALAAFISAAHRTASTRYTHRSDPAKQSYAFVNDSSLEDFWRAVCDEVNVYIAGTDTQRLDWLVRHIPGDAARALVGEMPDTGSLDEWREKIDARMRADAALNRLAALGAWALMTHRNDGEPCDVDGASIQDRAQELGLLQSRTVAQACGDACACAGFADFPTQCLFIPEVVRLAVDGFNTKS